MIELIRPCEFPDGKQFLALGKDWHYRLGMTGRWERCPGTMLGEHTGRDIKCPAGTPLLSPLDGRVITAGWMDPANTLKGLGFRVMLELREKQKSFDGGMVYPYVSIGHMSEIFVVKGGQVIAGKTILGLSGQTGNAEGAHVHVQATDPRFTDPLQFMQFNWR